MLQNLSKDELIKIIETEGENCVYCLRITIACPDYKRPWAYTAIYHFTTEEEAKAKALEKKNEFFQGMEYTQKENGKWIPSNEEDPDSFDDEEMFEKYYSDRCVYMDMPAFEAKIKKININDLAAHKKRKIK